MECPNCERHNRAEAGYCAWCGAALLASSQTAQEPLAADTPPTNQNLGGPRPTIKLIAPPALLAQPEGDGAAPEASAESTAALLRPGEVLAERYEIVELIEIGPERRVYRARDLAHCPYCGYAENPPDGSFCEACGAALDDGNYARIVERTAPEAYDDRFVVGAHEYYVTLEPRADRPPSPAVAAVGGPHALIWGRATDPGLHREHNEDYLEVWYYATGSGALIGLFVVADGLGGQDSGEVASRLATDTVWSVLREEVWEPLMGGEQRTAEELEAALVRAVQAANRQVYDQRTARSSEMSTTLTLALVVDGTAYIGNVGDSRTYLWGAAGLHQISVDHSLVQRLVDAGDLSREEVYTHPQRNLIYQSIGDRPTVEVDTFRQRLRPDERLILCSDGLWEMVRDDGLEDVLLSEPDPQRACDRLVENANLAGGEDNISVIIVQAVGATVDPFAA